MTIITFDFNKSSAADAPKEAQRYLLNNELGTVAPLNLEVYSCGYPIPEDGHIDGYPTGPAPDSVLDDVQCTFCDDVCEAPDIDSTIGFWDGCDFTTVIVTYSILGVFTLLWQLYIFFVKNPKMKKEWDLMIKDENQEVPKNINLTPE